MFKNSLYCIAIYILSLQNGYAADYQYNKPSELVGLLTEKIGVDCCINGIEKKVKFPAIELKTQINTTSANPTLPDEYEMPEQGVKVMQLVLSSPDLWKSFKSNKGKIVRIQCSLFHAISGHHMTPVLCEVSSISKPDELY